MLDTSATELSRALHARVISCRELMDATLTRIDQLNPRFNAIVSRVAAHDLQRQADACDQELARGHSRGWMHGFPMAVKDMCATAGIASTKGSSLLANHVPDHDDLLVQRMKAAGGIVIGKTNVPEFGLGSHTYNTVFGVTRNAYDASRSAGGSSGGAAVALALRMLPVADGSDMMGSLRNPAAFNNLFGLRPSFGRVPAWPRPDVWVSQLGTEGPMGRTVEDVAHLLRVQAGRDDRVPLSTAGNLPGGAWDLSINLKQVRIGWLADLGGHLPMEDGILALCRSALARLSDDGCMVSDAPPGFDPTAVWATWLTLRRWLVAATLRDHWRDPQHRRHLKPAAQWEAEQGNQLSAHEVFDASAQRSRFYGQMLRLFDDYDFLALPSAQVWPFDAELDWPKSVAGHAMDTYHRWMEVVIYATLAGLPAISVPVGFSATGLPMGMQLIGRPNADLAVLQLAKAHEERAQPILATKPSVLSEPNLAAG